MQKRNKGVCKQCGNFRRIRLSDMRCPMCINKDKFGGLTYKRNLGVCPTCKQTTHIMKKHGICKGCVDQAKYGIRRKPLVGICKVCKRDGLTLKSGKCTTCIRHGGTDLKERWAMNSKQELRMREIIVSIYTRHHGPNLKFEFNYRPKWLTKPGSNRPMEMDVAIPSLMLGFEYDGAPHLDKTHPGFKNANINDSHKIKLCEENGWNLIKVRSLKYLKDEITFEAMLEKIESDYFYGFLKDRNEDVIYAVSDERIRHEKREI